MPAKAQPVTDAELAVLKLLWESTPLTAGAILSQLYPKGSPSDRGTVQKLLQRLETKRIVARDRSTWPHTFRALVTRDHLAGQQIEALAAKLTDGSLVPFILHAVTKQRLSPRERAAIEELLKRRKS